MNIKVKPTTFLNKSGRLIKRSSHNRRILNNKLTLTDSKRRVKGLKAALDRVNTLTNLDKDKMEYGLSLSKIKGGSKVNINRGYTFTNKGKIAKAVDIPDIPTLRNYWKIHSHPSNNPLSINDVIRGGKKKGDTVFAITKDNSIYRSTRILPIGDKYTNDIKDTYNAAKAKLLNKRVIADAVLSRSFWEDTTQSQLTDEARAVAQHRLLKHLHDKKLIRYRYKLSDEMKNNLVKYKSIMDVEFRRRNNN